MKRKLFTSKIKTLLVAAVALAVVTTVVVALSSGATAGENIMSSLLQPLRSGVAALDRQAVKIYDYIFSYESLEAENAALKAQILEMEADVRTAQELKRENQRLQQLLELSDQHDDYRFEPAYIISWDASSWRSSFTIGKGTNKGLEAGMCAITENGQVVGLITEVGANWATVTTILDNGLEISASIASSGYTGVVQGTYRSEDTRLLRMNYLTHEAVIKNGDQVVTTGSTLYPKGLLLGKITNVSLDETGVAKYASLEASCSLEDLEQVFIITEYEAG
ncbi:MAG: rod shape-determining protein MreC [Oscillospiraceae bacterium]|nr:rod shape-determining protein MreC [Oscillospiraceae bacterium]